MHLSFVSTGNVRHASGQAAALQRPIKCTENHFAQPLSACCAAGINRRAVQTLFEVTAAEAPEHRVSLSVAFLEVGLLGSPA